MINLSKFEFADDDDDVSKSPLIARSADYKIKKAVVLVNHRLIARSAEYNQKNTVAMQE